MKNGLEANTGTDGAWELYSRGEAEAAVSNFGASSGMVFLALHPSPTTSNTSSQVHFDHRHYSRFCKAF